MVLDVDARMMSSDGLDLMLRQRTLELENGLEREREGLRHSNHSRQLVSHQVLESIYGIRCPVGGQRDLTMRFAGAR